MPIVRSCALALKRTDRFFRRETLLRTVLNYEPKRHEFMKLCTKCVDTFHETSLHTCSGEK